MKMVAGGQQPNAGLLADDGDGEFAAAGAVVEVAKHDLLPDADVGPAVDDGEAAGCTNEGAAEVSEAVVVAPAGVVGIVVMRRGDLVEGAAEVLDGAGLELDGGDTEGGAKATDVDDARLDAALSDGLSHFLGDVDDVAMAARRQVESGLPDGHRYSE